MAAETSQTLDRGLRVLGLLAEAPGGLTVSELAAGLGVSRTVVYRLLATLEQHLLVRRDDEGRARLGFGVVRLAGRVQPLLRQVAFMRWAIRLAVFLVDRRRRAVSKTFRHRFKTFCRHFPKVLRWSKSFVGHA